MTFLAAVAARAQAESPLTNSIEGAAMSLEPARNRIWVNGVGEGLLPTAQSFSVNAGASYGFARFGGIEAHDLAMVSFSYSHVVGHVLGKDRWYRGNTELRLELFTGKQFSPSSEWFVGLTPHLRYDFATGTRWMPYLDGGAGVTATSIGPPDLSRTFEFNLQAGGGVQWFLNSNVALNLEAHYMHWSSAGISEPNHGLNTIAGMAGISFFF